MTLPFHPLTTNYKIILPPLETKTTKYQTLLSYFTFGTNRENTNTEPTCMKRTSLMVCSMVTIIPMEYPYNLLICNYVMLFCSIKQGKQKICMLVFGTSTKDTIL